MISYLLFFLFFVMFAGGAFGLDVSVAPGLSVKNLFLYSLFSIFAVQTAVNKNRKLEALSVLGPFSLLLVYCFLSFATVVFIIKYPNYGVMEGAVHLKTTMVDHYLMLLVFFYGATKTEDVLWLTRAIVWLIILGNVLTLADAFGIPDLQIIEVHYSGRIQGLIGQPNSYGVFLAFFLPVIMALYISESGFTRLLAGVGVLVGFACLLLTFSRGSYVGLVFGAIIGSVYLRKVIAARTVAIAIVAAIVACVAIIPVLFIAGFGQIFIERISLLTGDAHTVSQGRSTLWLHALSVMLERPETFLTGYGWNAYANFREFRLVTHNTYLNYLFNIGIIGLFLFLKTLTGVFSELRRRLRLMPRTERSFVISTTFGFFALCVTIFFSELFNSGPLIWAFVGLALRLSISPAIENTHRVASGKIVR